MLNLEVILKRKEKVSFLSINFTNIAFSVFNTSLDAVSAFEKCYVLFGDVIVPNHD